MTDNASRVSFCKTYKHKHKAFHAIKWLIKHLKTQYGIVVKIWRIDGGKEFTVTEIRRLTDHLRAIIEITTLYTPEQDRVSERSIRILCKRTRTTMIDQGIPEFLWPEILIAMITVTNVTAT